MQLSNESSIYVWHETATRTLLKDQESRSCSALTARATGHSGVVVETVGGRIAGSIYTVLSVGLFFGSVLAAFNSYFILTWRKPKRQVVDTINYYLQRIDDSSADEIDDLQDMTRGLLLTAKERAENEARPDSQNLEV